KLLKSSCDAAFSSLSRGGVYYAFLFQSQPRISGFFSSTEPAVCVKCFTSAVSMEAHYRESFQEDKQKNAFSFQQLTF
ncbi:hypothetical protein N6N71_03475, partial [Escherichia albertii]